MKKIIALFLCVIIMAATLQSGFRPAAAEESDLMAVAEDSIVGPAVEGSFVGAASKDSFVGVAANGSVISAVAPVESIKPMPYNQSMGQPSQEELEAAIKAVKAKVTIPKEYSQFDYYFYGTGFYEDGYWNLTWSNPNVYGYIQVNVDKENHITSYNRYDSNNIEGSIPEYRKSELVEKANQFLKQIVPEIYRKLELVDSNFENIYSGTYSYHYERKENGISFPDNNAVVYINASTGEVRNANVNWLYDVKIPSAKVKLTKEEAAKIIGENLKMELTYRTNYYRIYDIGSTNYEQKAYLVYEPNPGYISIDAKTGEVYLTRSSWIERTTDTIKSEKDAANEAAGNTAAETGLTEEEIKKLNELGTLITKEKAIKLVSENSYLLIDKNLMSYNANLQKRYANYGSEEASYVWYIELRDPRPVDYAKDKDTYRAYASAQVDAKTGKILSFYASNRSNYDENGNWKEVKIPYDKKEGQEILEKFLKSQIKDRFENSKLVNQYEGYVAYYKENQPVFGGYTYEYQRVNEGVIYPYDGIHGAVDGVTGKIYSYNSYWNDNVVFESPKDAMTAEEAFEKYISKEGYHLVYEVNEVNIYDPNYKGEGKYYDGSEAYTREFEVRLVYRPDINPSTISPFTGEQLNYDGSVYKETEPYTYLDVPDTLENREILLLSDMNVGFEGEYFYPDKAITAGELASLFEKIGYGYYGISEDTKASDQHLTREELAVSFIKRLGLNRIAELKGIYSPGYRDQNSINPDYLGYVALAKGYGIMEADEFENFNPKGTISRREAIHLIFNFIKVQKNGIY